MTHTWLPAAVLSAMLVPLAGGSGHSAVAAGAAQDPSPDRVVNIAAERFTFTPSDITIEQGTTVEFRLTSDDTSHGFRLTGPGEINVEIPKRGRGDVRVLFEAREPGRYTFECSLVCGAGHSFMRGTVRVTPRDAQGGRR